MDEDRLKLTADGDFEDVEVCQEYIEKLEKRIAELEGLLDEWIQAYDDYEPFPISDECYVKTSKIVGNKNKREAKQEYEALKKKE